MGERRINSPDIDKNEVDGPPRPVLRRTVLRTTSVLPVLVTLLNGIAGFAAIHYATKAGLNGEGGIRNVMIAAWMIFAALLFDALDGRLARMTRQATDFGATPKLIISQRLSSWAPKSVACRVILASRPSSASNRRAAKIIQAAIITL